MLPIAESSFFITAMRKMFLICTDDGILFGVSEHKKNVIHCQHILKIPEELKNSTIEKECDKHHEINLSLSQRLRLHWVTSRCA